MHMFFTYYRLMYSVAGFAWPTLTTDIDTLEEKPGLKRKGLVQSKNCEMGQYIRILKNRHCISYSKPCAGQFHYHCTYVNIRRKYIIPHFYFISTRRYILVIPGYINFDHANADCIDRSAHTFKIKLEPNSY